MVGLIFSQINVIYLFFQRKCSSGVTSICSRSHTMRKKNNRTTKKSIFSETKKKKQNKNKKQKKQNKTKNTHTHEIIFWVNSILMLSKTMTMALKGFYYSKCYVWKANKMEFLRFYTIIRFNGETRLPKRYISSINVINFSYQAEIKGPYQCNFNDFLI